MLRSAPSDARPSPGPELMVFWSGPLTPRIPDDGLALSAATYPSRTSSSSSSGGSSVQLLRAVLGRLLGLLEDLCRLGTDLADPDDLVALQEIHLSWPAKIHFFRPARRGHQQNKQHRDQRSKEYEGLRTISGDHDLGHFTYTR